VKTNSWFRLLKIGISRLAPPLSFPKESRVQRIIEVGLPIALKIANEFTELCPLLVGQCRKIRRRALGCGNARLQERFEPFGTAKRNGDGMQRRHNSAMSFAEAIPLLAARRKSSKRHLQNPPNANAHLPRRRAPVDARICDPTVKKQAASA
jgi:hypothetical protein